MPLTSTWYARALEPLRGEAETAAAHQGPSVLHGALTHEANPLPQQCGLVGLHPQEVALPSRGRDHADGLVSAGQADPGDPVPLVIQRGV